MKIGIDLGGTTVSMGLLDDNLRIVDKMERMTHCEKGAPAVIALMEQMIEALLAKAGNPSITHIGLGCPGILDRNAGTVIYSNNIMWEQVPVCGIMKKKFGVPVYVENDANCAALGEYLAGAGRGSSHMVMVTFGTGIGGGIILNGRLYLGKHGNSNIIGHLLLKKDGEECTCGRNGCWECYASTKALLCRADQAGLFSGLEDQERRGPAFFKALKENQKGAAEVFERYVDDMAEGIADLINILDPERIVIGGGISAQGEALLAPVRKKVKQKIYFRDMETADIVCSQLANDAAIIGAASLPQVQQERYGDESESI